MSRRRRSDPEVERPLHRVPAASRRGNRVFYVAVEGGSTEPDYLGFLNRELGSELRFLIHPLYRSNGMTPTRVVARALEQRDEIRHGSGLVQLWAIFDRDQHHDILQAMRDAEAGGVTVAFSHPSFELWLLLHFSDFSGQQGGSSRVIHGKLRRQAGSRPSAPATTRASTAYGSWPLMASRRPLSSGRRGWWRTARQASARRVRDTPRTATRCDGTRRPTCGGSLSSWAS